MISQKAARSWIISISDPAYSLQLATSHFGFFRTGIPIIFERRTLSHDLIYLVIQETLIISLKGREPIDAVPGTFVYLPAGCAHEIRLPAGLAFQHLRFRLFHDGKPLAFTHRLFLQSHANHALQAFQEIESARKGVIHLFTETAIRAWLSLLFIEVCRNIGTPSTHRSDRRLSASAASASIRYITQHLASTPTAAELARHVGMTHDYYSRLFKKTFGQTPRTWIAREKMRRAAELLTTTVLRVQEVADELGFQSLSAFTESFRRHHGVPPSDYRARGQ